jgi:tetratricopeptide (TPR) repeat protein
MGYGHLSAGRPAAAESAYRQAMAFDPRDREITLGLAKALLAQNRQRAALPLLRDLCASEPNRPEYWLLQANAHLELRETEKALVILESAWRLGLLDAESQMTLGDLYYNRCLPRLAGLRYGRAYETGKIGDERLLRCAEVLHHAEDADGALKLLRRLKSPAAALTSRARLLEGRIAMERGDVETARKALDESLEADPLNGEALFALAELQRDAKQPDRAILTLERAARIRGREIEALQLLAEIEVQRDRFGKAVAYLERAQEMRPSARVGRYLEQVRKLAEEEARSGAGAP